MRTNSPLFSVGLKDSSEVTKLYDTVQTFYEGTGFPIDMSVRNHKYQGDTTVSVSFKQPDPHENLKPEVIVKDFFKMVRGIVQDFPTVVGLHVKGLSVVDKRHFLYQFRYHRYVDDEFDFYSLNPKDYAIPAEVIRGKLFTVCYEDYIKPSGTRMGVRKFNAHITPKDQKKSLQYRYEVTVFTDPIAAVITSGPRYLTMQALRVKVNSHDVKTWELAVKERLNEKGFKLLDVKEVQE